MVITSSTTTTGFAPVELEPAPQDHPPVLTLGEEAAASESARHLVGHEDAAERGSHHRRGRARAEDGKERRREILAERVASTGSMSTRAHWR